MWFCGEIVKAWSVTCLKAWSVTSLKVWSVTSLQNGKERMEIGMVKYGKLEIEIGESEIKILKIKKFDFDCGIGHGIHIGNRKTIE